MTNNMLKALKASEYSVQNTKCQGCGIRAMQFPDELTDDNIFEVKDKMELGSTNPVFVIYCGDCKKAGKHKDVQQILYERDGFVYQRPAFNLIDRTADGFPETQIAITNDGTIVKRDAKTGKIVSTTKENTGGSITAVPSSVAPSSVSTTSTTSTTKGKSK
jgi:hypothetical protein